MSDLLIGFCVGMLTLALCQMGLARDWPSRWLRSDPEPSVEARRRLQALATAGEDDLRRLS